MKIGLARGVKNVIGLKRPVPYEVNLQSTDWFINLIEKFKQGTLSLVTDALEKEQMLKQLVIEASSVFVKLCFTRDSSAVVVILVLILCQKALVFSVGKNDASN